MPRRALASLAARPQMKLLLVHHICRLRDRIAGPLWMSRSTMCFVKKSSGFFQTLLIQSQQDLKFLRYRGKWALSGLLIRPVVTRCWNQVVENRETKVSGNETNSNCTSQRN